MFGRALTTLLFASLIFVNFQSAEAQTQPAPPAPTATDSPQLTPSPPSDASTSSTTTTTLVQMKDRTKLEPLPPDWLERGVQDYQKGNYTQAEALFSLAIAHHPDEGRAFYNLGLVEFKLNHPGLALARWRQALDLNPRFSQAGEATRYARSQISSVEGADFSLLWWGHTGILNQVPLALLLGLEAIFILFLGIATIRFMKRVRDPQPEPKPKQGRLIFWSAVVVIVGFFDGIKIWDQSTPWATSVQKKIAAHSTWSEDSATLFEISEGQELIVLRMDNGWYEIQMPSEKVGWVPGASILLTSVSTSVETSGE